MFQAANKIGEEVFEDSRVPESDRRAALTTTHCKDPVAHQTSLSPPTPSDIDVKFEKLSLKVRDTNSDNKLTPIKTKKRKSSMKDDGLSCYQRKMKSLRPTPYSDILGLYEVLGQVFPYGVDKENAGVSKGSKTMDV